MLRRRVERKAKLAATSLFKRVASGCDWNPDSPGIPEKQATKQTKCESSSRKMKPKYTDTGVSHSCNSLAKKDEKVSPKTLPVPMNLRSRFKKVGVNRQDVPSFVKKGTKTSSLSSKSVPASKKDGQRSRSEVNIGVTVSPLKRVSKMPLKLVDSATTSTKDGIKSQKNLTKPSENTNLKRLKQVSDLPKKCTVRSTQRSNVLTDRKDDKMAAVCNFLSRSEDAVVLQQKLSVSPKMYEETACCRLSVMLDAKNLTLERQLKDVNSMQVLEKHEYNSGGNEAILNDEILPNDGTEIKEFRQSCGQRMNSLASCEKIKAEFPDSLGTSPRKRRSEEIAISDVCVKLTKLDERSLATIDVNKQSPKSQKPVTPPFCNSERCTESAFVTKNKADPGSSTDEPVVYPSGRMDGFLQLVGLIHKSEVKKLDLTPNRLHRDAGGKLRRFIKPRLMPGMIYRRSNDASTDRERHTIADVGFVSLGNKGGPLRSNQTVPTFSNLSKFAALHGSKSTAVLSRRPLTAENILDPKNEKSQSKCKMPDSSSKQQPFSTDNLDVGMVVVPNEFEGAAADKTPTKRNYQPRKTKVKPTGSTAAVPNPETTTRRSARQLGHGRKAWSHLLRANPDEWDGGFRNVTRNLSLSIPKCDISATDRTSRNSTAISFDSLAGPSAFDVSSDLVGLKELLRKGRGTTNFDRLNSSLLPSLGAGHKEEPRKGTSKENSLERVKCVKGSKSPGTNKNVGLKDNEEISGLAGDKFLVGGLRKFNFDDYALLSYRSSETDCIVPHMCSVCWVNDHMYCKNMKRTTGDLPPFGGCLHYIPCYHYMQRESLTHYRPFHYRRCHSKQHHAEVRDPVPGTVRWSDEDLMCRERMPDFDSEPCSSVFPDGTEVLSVRLHNRADQIVRCLGVDRLPDCFDQGHDRTDANSGTLEAALEEARADIVPEEFGAEVSIENADDDLLLELGLRNLGDVPENISNSDPPSMEKPENGLAEFEDQSEALSLDDDCEPIVADKPVFKSPAASNARVVCVQVQKLGCDRVVITYPKKFSDSCGEPDERLVVKKEVKFAAGADDKSIYEFLASEALRLVNEEPIENQKDPALHQNREPGSAIPGSSKSSPPFSLSGGMKKKRPRNEREASTSARKHSSKKDQGRRKRTRKLDDAIQSETVDFKFQILNDGSGLESDKKDVQKFGLSRLSSSQTSSPSRVETLEKVPFSSSAHESAHQEQFGATSCERSGEYVTAADSVTTASMECSSSAGPCSSAEDFAFDFVPAQDGQHVARSDIANQVSETSILNDRPVLYTIDQLPVCTTDCRNALQVDNSFGSGISSSDGSISAGRYLPLIVESQSALRLASVSVRDELVLPQNEALYDKAKCKEPELSSVVVQDRRESAASLLSATDGERKLFCSSALSVVGTNCANFTLAPISGAALSSLAVSVSSAPFGHTIPVVFANCGPLVVAGPVSLTAGGSRTTKSTAAAAAPSSHRSTFPNIAPKTVSSTVSQNTISDQLAPVNSGVVPSSSSSDSRLACRNGVVYVLQAGGVFKEK